MTTFRTVGYFPVLDPDAAADADAGQIEITVKLVEKGLERAVEEKAALGTAPAGMDRLVAKPLDPVTARIPD